MMGWCAYIHFFIKACCVHLKPERFSSRHGKARSRLKKTVSRQDKNFHINDLFREDYENRNL